MYAAPMQEKSIRLPFGSGSMAFELPRTWRVETAMSPAPPVQTLERLAAQALANPVAGPRLRDLAGPRMRITIVVPDATRACPTPLLLDALWPELSAAGVAESQITLLVALGMHRRLSTPELAKLLREWTARCRIEQAQGNDASDYRKIGDVPPSVTGLSASIPVGLHPLVLDCDLLIGIGLVEPHQLAGFSGGRKTVAIGCASSETIAELHAPALLEHASARLGNLARNPLHLALEWIAEQSGLRFVLNIAESGDGRVYAAAAGLPGPVLATLVKLGEPYFWSRVPEGPYDAVFAGVPPPKDANLYQASRAQTYVAFARKPLVRDGGWIVTAAGCDEGAGAGPGELEFKKLMQGGVSPEDILARLRVTPYHAGGQRAFLVAKAMMRHRLMMVGMRDPTLGRSCHFDTAAEAREAMSRLEASLGADARVLVVPNALGVMPVPG